jgi:peptidoglycan L-alanyl-D-glutamate endopeptidase CwlK
MPSFSSSSQKALETAHPLLQEILQEAIKHIDFSVLEGWRSAERQDALWEQGLSKKKAGESRHNSWPAEAVDIAPYPIDWKDTERFVFLAGVVWLIGKQHGVEIRWGGDWDSDKMMKDENFRDYSHFELKKYEE